MQKVKESIANIINQVKLDLYSVHDDNDNVMEDVYISDHFDYNEALDVLNEAKGAVSDDWTSRVLTKNILEFKDKNKAVNKILQLYNDEYIINTDDFDELKHEVIEELKENWEDYFYIADSDIIGVEKYKSVNQDSDKLLEQIQDAVCIEFNVVQCYSKYLTVYSTKDDFVSVSVRIADHSQRFRNIRSDYSISIVVADLDATGSERNFFQKGFARKEIEPGDTPHAQIYINTEMDKDEAIEYAIESINEQLRFAEEDSLGKINNQKQNKMITVKNFTTAVTDDLLKQAPDTLKQLYPSVKNKLQFYNESEKIKALVDTYISKLNAIAGSKSKPKPAAKPQKKKPVNKQAERKASATKKPATKPKAKTQKQLSFEQVAKVSPEVRFVKRYVMMNNKRKTRKQLLAFINSLQRAIEKKEIRKTSKYAKEIMHIQNELLKIYNNPDVGEAFTFKLDESDKSIVEKFNKIAGSEKQRVSVRLISRYIGIHGKTNVKEKAERLLKAIKNAVKTKKVTSSDPYYKEMKSVEDNLEEYLKAKETKLTINKIDLKGLQGIAENSMKREHMLKIIANPRIYLSKYKNDVMYFETNIIKIKNNKAYIKGLGGKTKHLKTEIIYEQDFKKKETGLRVIDFRGDDNDNYQVLINNKDELLVPTTFLKQIEKVKRGGIPSITMFGVFFRVYDPEIEELSPISKSDVKRFVGMKNEKILNLQEYADSILSYMTVPYYFFKNGIYHLTYELPKKKDNLGLIEHNHPLKPGDKVITWAGEQGTVDEIKQKGTVTLKEFPGRLLKAKYLEKIGYQKPTKPNQKKEPAVSGVITAKELEGINYNTFGFTGKWLSIIGDPAIPFNLMFWSKPGKGKSSLAIQLSKYLAERFNQKVLFVAKEEGLSYTLKDKFARFNAFHPNIHIVEELPASLEGYDVVTLDSVTRLKMKPDDFVALKKKYPQTTFILVFQATSDGGYRGNKEWEHEVDVSIFINDNGYAHAEKTRFGGTGTIKVFKGTPDHIYKFTHLQDAEKFVANRKDEKLSMVQGDDGKVWVTNTDKANELKKQGYQLF